MTELVPVLQNAEAMPGVIAVETNHIHGGIQAIVRFQNGYGASVVNHEYSYGTELAVIRFGYFSNPEQKFDLVYDTPITGDVIGHIQNAEELLDILARIRDLPNN